MRIIPTGNKLLIRTDKVEAKTKGGILLATDTVKNEALAQVRGTIEAIGFQAWKDLGGGDAQGYPWAEVGDRVMYQKYAGMRIPDGRGGYLEDLVLILDNDITAVIVDEENDA